MSNALAILTEARELGISVTVDGTKIVLEGEALTEDFVARFRPLKPEVLRLLTSCPVTEKPTATPVPEATALGMGLLCDDCGRPTVVALVTSYGGRYCRACVFPDAAKVDKAPVAKVDKQEELLR